MSGLSKNFGIGEFIRVGDMQLCRQICPDYKTRICKILVVPVLQPLRAILGSPVRITSGFRSPEHNNRIGGNPYSHHLFNADRCAADFTTEDMPEAWRWLELHKERFCYVYWDKERNFIHLSGLTKTDDRVGIMWVIEKKQSDDKELFNG
jgi:hypothetical protein